MNNFFTAENLRKNRKELILLGSAFLFFLFMALYKLTSAPLWLDETWEFYFSKVMFGQIPGVSAEHNMYERILDTGQPPLYNIVLFVWLWFGESEWWFRLSSVVMGVISAAGLYQCIKRISSYRIASLSVVIYACIYQVIYHVQECAEYVMLLMFMTWMLYTYVLAMEETNTKHMIGFTVLCVLCMYTQYGAVFAVLPLLFSLFLKTALEKDWTNFKKITGIYLTAFFAAALPLIFFFFIPQTNNQYTPRAATDGINFYKGNLFADHLQMFLDVFRWNTIDSMTRFYALSLLASILLLALAVICFIFGKSKVLKHLMICNLFTWFSFYALTRLEVYAYGYFGARYNIFFIPLWLVTILYMLVEAYRILGQIPKESLKKRSQFFYRGIMIVMAVGYCVYGSHQILKHWEKADTRGCVQTWYDQEGYDITTLVNWDQAKSFTYYFEHDDRYRMTYEQNVIREMEKIITGDDDFEKEYQQYKAYLDAVFKEGYPDELYYFVGDDERNQLLKVLEDMGYTVDTVYKTTAVLCYIYK